MKLVSTALEVHKWRGIILKIWIGCSIWENNGIAAKLFESMIRPLHYFTELIVWAIEKAMDKTEELYSDVQSVSATAGAGFHAWPCIFFTSSVQEKK